MFPILLTSVPNKRMIRKENDYFSNFRFVSSRMRICCIAIRFSLTSRSLWDNPSLMSTAFRLSMFDRHISSFTPA